MTISDEQKQRITRGVERLGDLAKILHDATADFIDSHDRHDVATMMLMGMCRALVSMYPERASDGRTIIEVMSKMMLDFPVPEYHEQNGTTIQ